jgi:PAS domain S-box-containing protein
MSVFDRSHFLRWFARPLILEIAAVLTLSITIAFLGLQNWRDRQAVNLSIEHGRQVIDTLDRLKTIIVDLEAERHGYLLTLDPAYLKAYGVSDESVRREAEALQVLVANDPLQSFRAGHLALIVLAKLREIDGIVKTATRVSGQAAQAMIRGMDDIRLQIDLLQDVERLRLADEEKRAGELEQRRMLLTIGAGVIVAVLAGTALARARREAKRRRKATEENVQLQSGLQERDRKIRRLVDSNIIGVMIWDRRGRILEANDAFLHTVGYEREDLAAGRLHCTMLTPPEWRDVDARNIAQMELMGTLAPFEREYLRKDGSRVSVLIGAAMFEEDAHQGVGFVLDLTDRKRAEEALRRSEAYLAEAQRLSHTGTSVYSERGILYWSEECYRIWEFDPLQGLPDAKMVLQRIHPDDRDRVREETRNDLQRKREQPLEFKIVSPDGTVKDIEIISHPLLSAEEVIATHVDVTERRRAQEQSERLRQLEADLAHMNRLGIMGELTSSLAHEILHPIAAARNNARIGMRFLELSPPNLGEVRGALACVVKDADRAKDIVDRIRDHIKKAPPRQELFDLNQAIDEVIFMLRHAIEKNRVLVETRLRKGIVSVRGDRVQMQQVVLNLILNGVEAMSSVGEGPRKLSISTELNDENRIIVAVRDSGPGINPEHLDLIFKPFHTTKLSGMGMGLSICRSIIATHGGHLWAETQRDRGAIFQFTLPSGLEDP